MKYRQLYFEKSSETLKSSDYRYWRLPDGRFELIGNDPQGQEANNARIFRMDNLTSQGSPNQNQPLVFQNKEYNARQGNHWKANWPEGMNRLSISNRIFGREGSLAYVRYLDDFPVLPITNMWADTSVAGSKEGKWYVVQTNPKVIERCILMTTDPGDLVLDPTCGSGTTAYVAEQWGRRWITIDTSRVALALARTRLMSAKFPYFLLADSNEGQRKEQELQDSTPAQVIPFPTPQSKPIAAEGKIAYLTTPQVEHDIKKGFVYKRVPHITLKSIANNPEIDTIHSKWQERLEPLRTQLNQLLNKTWEDWQIPREPEAKWPDLAKTLLTQWWEKRRERQKEIDNAISRHADIEILYDQPYEDSKRIRVSGPFTVESLSPHRVLAPDDQDQPTSVAQAQEQETDRYLPRIIENLRKAGVQNTKRNERLSFDRLEPYAGRYIHATGDYTDKEGIPRRVAVHIGPEHGTITPDDLKETAKEASKGLGYELLIICGFAFDPHVSEETKRYGSLPILIARMYTDLLMGDDLLKKTGAGNLFMVFGEPDLDIDPQADGQLIVKLHGLDIYDPTTGEIRSSTTDDIACWFIDTNYNEESFFVRHAYFTGADEPYEKLKRALKAEIDESAWSTLYSTTSRPFPVPSSGKIAIKVINHYGDEVLKVYEVMK